MDILDLDDAWTGANAKLKEFEREWATQFFAPLLDISAGQLLRSLPMQSHQQMQARQPEKYQRTMQRFIGKKGRYDNGAD